MKDTSFNNNLYKEGTKWDREVRQALHQSPVLVNDMHFQATIRLAEREVCLRQGRTRISYLRFLGKQIRFTGRRLWAVQGILLLLISMLLSRFLNQPFTPGQMLKLPACLSVLLVMPALPLLYRSVRWRMQEVEAASRFSGVKLLSAKLIAIGIGDICLLTGIFLATILKTVLPADSVLFCLCFPFLLAGGGCLYLLGHFPPGQFFAGSLLYCGFLLVAFGITHWQDTLLYQPPLPMVRAILCALLFVFCVQQVRYLLRASSYMEMQLQ